MKPRVGVSACLLGERVRFDGGHKHDPVLTDLLGPRVEFVSVCPEVEVGMGIPRPPLHLEGARMVETDSGRDWTDPMNAYAEARVAALDHLDGYVFKSKSPSCGLAPTRGLFAEAVARRWPDLPMVEERDLQDSALREDFIRRVFAGRTSGNASESGEE